MVKIRVTRIEPPGPEDGQSLPVVHFEGFSKSLDSSLDENANSGLTGEVSAKGTGSFRGLLPVAQLPLPPPLAFLPCLDLLPHARWILRGVREENWLTACFSTGSVRLTREGEVRWTSHSIFNGQERWRSESIQVGGLRSAKVVGNWFDK